MSEQHCLGLTGRLQRAAGSGQRAVAAGLLPSRSRLRLAGRENGSDAFPAKSGSNTAPSPITGRRALASTRSSFTSVNHQRLRPRQQDLHTSCNGMPDQTKAHQITWAALMAMHPGALGSYWVPIERMCAIIREHGCWRHHDVFKKRK